MSEQHFAQVGYENYYQMLSDNIRMEAYRKAIFKCVKPGDVVVDLGAGTGLLTIWAIKAGAKKVYAIEKTDAIHLAAEIAKANGCLDKVEFIQKNSLDVTLPQKADVIVSETLGSFGIDENALIFTNDARKRFLKENGIMIPENISLFNAPVEDAKCYHKLDFWRHIPDIDFTPAFNLFSSKIMIESVNPHGLLALPVCIGEINFKDDTEPTFVSRVYIQMNKGGTIHGMAGWFNVTLCDGIEISTAPTAPQTHWKQAFMPLKETINVIEKDVFDWTVCIHATETGSDHAKISYEYRCTQLQNELNDITKK